MNPIEILLLLLSSPILGVFCYVVPHTYDSLGLTGNQYYPLVLWHGLGDTYNSSGILSFISEIQGAFPGILVYSAYVDKDQDKDRKASWFGNVNDQIGLVAKQLQAISELQGGFVGVGISQGGQFLRGYIERFNNPPARALVTFGAQHMGVSKTADCEPGDFFCQSVQRIIRFGVYNSWVQSSVVPAQYFRDPSRMEEYLDSNNFLADINNERSSSRNPAYANNLASLEKLVLILFREDTTVIPKESSWFGSYAPAGDSAPGEPTIIPMKQQPLYTEDWIGLRKLDSENRIKFITCEGGHLHYSECWDHIIKEHVGIPKFANSDQLSQHIKLLVQ